MKAITLLFCLSLTSLAYATATPAEKTTVEAAHAEKAKHEQAVATEHVREPAASAPKANVMREYDVGSRMR